MSNWPTTDSPRADEIFDLFDAYALGELNAADSQRLSQILLEDAAARQQFVVLAHIVALAEQFEGAQADEAAIETMLAEADERSNLSDEPLASSRKPLAKQDERTANSDQGSAISDPLSAPFSPPSILTPHSSRKSLLNRASQRPKWPSIAVATLVMVGALGWAAVTYVNDRVADGGRKKSNDEQRETKKLDYVAKLSNWHEPVWLEDTRPPARLPQLKIGRRLKIKSGLIEVTYLTGARVVIEGPAEFVVGSQRSAVSDQQSAKEKTARSSSAAHQATASGLSPRKLGGRSLLPQSSSLNPQSSLANSGYLKLGKLTARVEGEDAHGFTIDTPMASIEDLGTQFGVVVSESGLTDAVVLTGKIECQRDRADGTVERLELAAGEGTSIRKDIGSGDRLRKSTPNQIALIKKQISRSSMAINSNVVFGATGKRLVRASLPSHYRAISIENGSFESPKTETYEHSIGDWIDSAGGSSVTISGIANPAAPYGKQWLALDGRDSGKNQPGWVFQKIGTIEESLVYRLDVVIGTRGDGYDLAEYEAGFFTDDDGKFGTSDGPKFDRDGIIATFDEGDFSPAAGQQVDAFVEWDAAESGRAGQDLYVGFYIPERGFSGNTVTQTWFDGVLVTVRSEQEQASEISVK